jgi:hypothetical protein
VSPSGQAGSSRSVGSAAPGVTAFPASGGTSGAGDAGAAEGEAAAPEPTAPIADPNLGAGADPGGRADDPADDVAPPSVRLMAARNVLSVGEEIAVTVEIHGANDVGHAPFHVTFDPSILSFVSATEGPFLSSDGQGTAFFASPLSDGTAVTVGLSRLGRVPGISGSGELCALHFVAVASGDTTLAFQRAHVRDSRTRIVPAAFESLSIRVR